MTRRYVPTDQVAAVIHQTLLAASEDGLTKAELLKKTGFTAGQFNRGYDLLKDTLHSRGTPINVTRTHPFRYSIPLPINSEESSYYELRRLAIIANTSLQRLQKHAVAAESHHPQKAEAFHALAAMANRARKTIAKTLGNMEDSE